MAVNKITYSLLTFFNNLKFKFLIYQLKSKINNNFKITFKNTLNNFFSSLTNNKNEIIFRKSIKLLLTKGTFKPKRINFIQKKTALNFILRKIKTPYIRIKNYKTQIIKHSISERHLNLIKKYNKKHTNLKLKGFKKNQKTKLGKVIKYDKTTPIKLQIILNFFESKSLNFILKTLKKKRSKILLIQIHEKTTYNGCKKKSFLKKKQRNFKKNSFQKKKKKIIYFLKK